MTGAPSSRTPLHVNSPLLLACRISHCRPVCSGAVVHIYMGPRRPVYNNKYALPLSEECPLFPENWETFWNVECGFTRIHCFMFYLYYTHTYHASRITGLLFIFGHLSLITNKQGIYIFVCMYTRIDIDIDMYRGKMLLLLVFLLSIFFGCSHCGEAGNVACFLLPSVYLYLWCWSTYNLDLGHRLRYRDKDKSRNKEHIRATFVPYS
jgi:hypothetical protein